ncbi:MAG: multicomponent Na+:H+ antiporter subunit [Clostridia bacterium]|nr:multicomponent Na+:H+ antiporter subunit [Clostridia bacterium]
MYYFFLICVAAISLKILIVLYRVLQGPTVFDRIIGLGVIGTDIILFLLLIGALKNRLDMFVDMSIAYAALGLISYLILAKYFERKGNIDG